LIEGLVIDIKRKIRGFPGTDEKTRYGNAMACLGGKNEEKRLPPASQSSFYKRANNSEREKVKVSIHKKKRRREEGEVHVEDLEGKKEKTSILEDGERASFIS